MKQEYHIGNDNIIRRKVGKKMNPACPNDWLQPLLEKKIRVGKLSEKEDRLYGQLIMSLVEIVLNNKKFKFQSDYIRDDIRLEMLEDILVNVPKTYNPNKGKAYSYAFRTAYTAGIHVLERYNHKRDMEVRLEEEWLSNLCIDE